MNRAKKSKRPRAKPTPSGEPDRQVDSQQAAQKTVTASKSTASWNLEAVPSGWVRNLMSVAVVVHLFAVAISFLSVVEPSETQLAVLARFNPYLRATHFGADDRPVYLAHADALEQPHRLQILHEGGQWQTVHPAGVTGFAPNDRYARWTATIASLAEADQPGLVASLLIPEIKRLGTLDSELPIEQVRVIRLPTELTTVVDDAEPPPYLARVIVRNDSIDLVQVKEQRLNAMASSRPNSLPDASEGGGNE